MFKRLKENEKGLTLIELLVVIVILGIIAAIAVIAIGNIIDNSKKDAHISNAKQIANAAKLYEAGEDALAEEATIKLEDLYKSDYLEKVKDPSTKKGFYNASDSTITKVKASEKDGESSPGGYKVKLVGDGGTYIKGDKVTAELDRGDVTLKEKE